MAHSPFIIPCRSRISRDPDRAIALTYDQALDRAWTQAQEAEARAIIPAMWTYSQSSGALSLDGSFIYTGYSGHGDGLNNPDYQSTPDIGPIPQGHWHIGPARNGGKLGPLVMPLTPDSDSAAFGRSGFFIHGDNAKGDHSGSCGCVVLPYPVRARINTSGDTDLTVTA
jgi:hypothetical protein